MTKKEIKTIRETAYEKYCAVGPSAVYDYANTIEGIEYDYCEQCDASTPTLEDGEGLCECLLCGSGKNKGSGKHKIRPIEMYIGEGSDFGTWGTEYVDIPIDTPDDKIEQVAKDKVHEDFAEREFIFCGVYAIVPLEDLDDFYDDDYD
jgi:hypothetical protein